jgi:hypothetical protein
VHRVEETRICIPCLVIYLASWLCIALDSSLTTAAPPEAQNDAVVIFANIELMSSTLGRLARMLGRIVDTVRVVTPSVTADL